MSLTNASKAISLFNAGHWSKAQNALHHCHEDFGESMEISAVLGICKMFSTSPAYLRNDIDWDNLEKTAILLSEGKATGWPDVSACKAWLQLLKERSASPDKIPESLDTLAEACQQSQWFPVWSLAFRALAYYDQRQIIQKLIERALESSANHSCGLRLVLAEAQLECAWSSSYSLLKNIDVENCLPLAPEIAHMWHQWLLAEFEWWEEWKPDRIQGNIAALLQIPSPENNPYSQKERIRLLHHIALLGARCALSQQRMEDTHHWIKTAAHYRPESWENKYFEGLVAWSQGDIPVAQAYLENSLNRNPFQSRVCFELGIMLSSAEPADTSFYLENMPGVYDAVASSATALFQLGRKNEASMRLDQLEQAEAPYSVRLIWPHARMLRLRQGSELCIHLAAAGQDWLKALNNLDITLASSLSSQIMIQPDRRVKDLIYRARRLYLLKQCLEQQMAEGEGSFDKTLNAQFHKELGKLSIRPLMGEAMFYRSLAAEKNMPGRAIDDWRALLRQSSWVEKTKRTMPERFLYIGDRLLKAGLNKDAYKAYTIGSEASVAGAQKRMLLSKLLIQPLDANNLLLTLDASDKFTRDEAFLFFLRGLCFLAKEPPDYESAKTLMRQAARIGLPEEFERLSKLLPALESDVSSELCSFLDEKISWDLPPAFRTGLEILCRSDRLTAIQRFKEVFGDRWITWCPIHPEIILGWQLRGYCAQSDYATALDKIQEAEKSGCYMPDKWKAFLYASQAIQIAMHGDFETARRFQQLAFDTLLQRIDENEDNI